MQKMITRDGVTIKKHNPNWPQISNHQHRILLTGGSGTWKINSLFNLKSRTRYR